MHIYPWRRKSLGETFLGYCNGNQNINLWSYTYRKTFEHSQEAVNMAPLGMGKVYTKEIDL